MHVLAAVFRAVNDALAGRLKSRNVHSEIVFALGPSSNVGTANFSSRPFQHALVVTARSQRLAWQAGAPFVHGEVYPKGDLSSVDGRPRWDNLAAGHREMYIYIYTCDFLIIVPQFHRVDEL